MDNQSLIPKGKIKKKASASNLKKFSMETFILKMLQSVLDHILWGN